MEAAGLASCCQQWSHQDWKGGGMCYHRGRPAAANRVTEGIKPRDPLLPPPARPALAGRKGIGLVSLLPRPLWGLLSECILNYPGNSDMFRKEKFFVNILY